MVNNDNARLPSVNKNMFDNGNWQAFTAVVKYIEDLTVWAATTKEKGEDGKKYNLLWLLPRIREGEGGRGEIDMNNFPLLDVEAHRNCHAKLYEQLYFNLNNLVPELVSQYPITDYDSEDPDKGYIDEKYRVATALLWAFKDFVLDPSRVSSLFTQPNEHTPVRGCTDVDHIGSTFGGTIDIDKCSTFAGLFNRN